MARLPLFDGFPYLTTRIVPALYHVMLLPGGQPDGVLVALAQAQVEANRLQACLALGENRAIYFDTDGQPSASDEPTRGGTLICGRLGPPVDFIDTDELKARQARLEQVVAETRRGGGYLTGDLTKGGRRATWWERWRLAGLNGDGSPRGLARCATCGDWRGMCLDPSEEFRGQVMTVHCLCDNHNRCARCGALLHARRLNANCYNASDGQVWHVPGFSGLSHECQTEIQWDTPDPVSPAGEGEDEFPRYRAEVFFRDEDEEGPSVYCVECGPRLPGAEPGVLFDARRYGCKRCRRLILDGPVVRP